MKLNIAGKLTNVSEVIVKDSYKFQAIQITQSGFNQVTGEPIPPEVYEATIFNKKIDELQAHFLAGKQVIATCWTKSIPKEHNGTTFYNISLNCSALHEHTFNN